MQSRYEMEGDVCLESKQTLWEIVSVVPKRLHSERSSARQ